MTKVEFYITFKDGTTVKQYSEFEGDARSDFFYGFSQGFKENAKITINNEITRKYNDIKSIEITFV